MPFSFRVYAILEVSSRLADKDVHELIDMLAPNLRSQEQEGDRIIRKREFYNMPAEDAFKILVKLMVQNFQNCVNRQKRK